MQPKAMMVMSDIHIEWNPFHFHKLPNVNYKEIILVLAGDICEVDNNVTNTQKLLEFLHFASGMFHSVVYVFGNHEFYGGNMSFAKNKLQSQLDHHHLYNIHILDQSVVNIGDTNFIGCTLWSDFEKGNPLVIFDAQALMRDYKKIRFGGNYRKISPSVISALHIQHKNFIIDSLTNLKGKNNVVITHHAPSWLSVPPKYSGDRLNGAYVSDLSDIILDHSPKMWIHGHMHSTSKYMVGNTKIVCNPRGHTDASSGKLQPFVDGNFITDYTSYVDAIKSENDMFDYNLIYGLQ